VVAYLLRNPPRQGNVAPLVRELLLRAQRSKTSFMAVLTFSENPKILRFLAENPFWMSYGMPKYIDTLNLFCRVILQRDLRPEIVVHEKELCDLLIGVLNLHDREIPAVICTIIRRLQIAPSLLAMLSDRGFIGAYFLSIQEFGEAVRGLIALRVFAEVSFIKEFVMLVDFVVENIMQTDKRSPSALTAAIQLAKYPACAAKFREARVADFLLRKRWSGTLVDQFIEALQTA
jgi:hypothetical protein